ncbi:MAG: PKD domain-containing protein, partial [Bacteroidia bacterium]
TNVPITAGTAAFFALRFNFNAGNTSLSLYVNPASLGNTTPASPTLTQTTGYQLNIRGISVYLGDNANSGALDEYRMASTYACVAPDNAVSVNFPPVAAFTKSATSGQAPFTVNFDASTSSDPENGALTYEWNFGDGTTATGQTPSHQYGNILGILNVCLTVTDNTGQSSTACQNITTYNSNGYYPCENTFTLMQPASCGQNNGFLRVNNPPATFSLRNSNNIAMPVTNGNQFQNLPTGNYLYTSTSGVGGCRDTFHLTIPTDSSTCAGWQPNACALKIGVNLSGVEDWAFERPFRNLFLHTRNEFLTFHDNCNCWSNGAENQIVLDSAAYPLQIPQVTTASNATHVRFVLSSNGGNLRQGQTYVLLYDGIGTLNMGGDMVQISNANNRIEFTAGATNIWLDMTSSQLGNHIRNIRLLRLADEFATDLESQPFYATFLEKIAPFHSLRFMDWAHTNNSPHITWTDRRQTYDRCYTGIEGVPYERIIQLANIAQKDVWICVPHQADDNYIIQMATLFRDNLAANRTIYLEYSNEVWNWMFDQAHYNEATRPSNLNYGEAISEKAKHTFQLWHSVFGTQKDRVKRVLGLQATNNWLNEYILSQIPQDEWDYASPTFYFGPNHGGGTPALNGSSTATDILQNATNFYRSVAYLFHQDYRNTQLFGKKIINYEGGQHFTDFTQPPYLQAMYDAQIHPQMYDLYDEVLDSVRIWGSEMGMAFTLAGARESIYGSWGHLEHIDQDTMMQPAPKYQALLDNMCAPVNPPLAIEWADFQVNPYKNEAAILNWASHYEVQNWGFEVERSTDNALFEKIAWVNGKNAPNSFYKWVDNQIDANVLYYYRLKQIDFDGKYTYSATKTCMLTGREHLLLLSPNPNTGKFSLVSDIPTFVQIYNLQGQLLYEEKQEKTRFELSLPQLPAGMYLVKTGNGMVKWWKI